MESSELSQFSEIQSHLFTVERLLELQHGKQEQLTNEMLSSSNELIIELRLLALSRCFHLKEKRESVQKMCQSQILMGLRFSSLVYCPTFFDSNLLNHYMAFVSYLRSHPASLARCFYHFAKTKPNKTLKMAHSVFLTLFQMGWCAEEDKLLWQTLKAFFEYQMSFEGEQPPKSPTSNQFDLPPKRNAPLRHPLRSATNVLSKYEPFVSYLSAYLFNGAAFAYLQCALSPTVSLLNTLSSLRDIHNSFTVDKEGVLGDYDYWRTIVKHAVFCFKNLTECLELLPQGVRELFTFIRTIKGDEICILFFFEAFVNRCLDSPAILGIVPWNPSQEEWSPTRDVANVFRAMYQPALLSNLDPLIRVLSTINEFTELNLSVFIEKLVTVQNTVLIHEAELISTNPNFPKELVITGGDLCLLHDAAASLPESEIPDQTFEKDLKRLGAVRKKNKSALEHFRIVLQRPKEVTAAAQNFVQTSLFQIGKALKTLKTVDPFAEFFCDIVSTLPQFSNFIEALNPTDIMSFLIQIRELLPHFIEAKDIQQADSVLFRAINGGESDSLLKRMNAVMTQRHAKAMDAADRTSAIRTQHQRINNSLNTVTAMRKNVQSYLLQKVTAGLSHEDIHQQFTTSVSRSFSFMTDLYLYGNTSIALVEAVNGQAITYSLRQEQREQISRILFFRLTQGVNVNQYLMINKEVWKRSVILGKIVETNYESLCNEQTSSWQDEFELRKKYLVRASQLLGHIKPGSGISLVLYYIVEAVSIVTSMSKLCPDVPLDPCLLWMLINSQIKHIYGMYCFIKHFLLGNQCLDSILTSRENQALGNFCSAVCVLLRSCTSIDSRITNEWD